MKTNPKRILVTGGAGYIGAHVCRALALEGHIPVVFDDFSTGHRSSCLWGEVIEGSLLDKEALLKACSSHIDAVVHLAAKALVGESTQIPETYFEHNVVGTQNLLEAMEEAEIGQIIFSSTCALYAPTSELLSEKDLIDPKSPYGLTKWMAEEVIRRSGMGHVIFRYFNAAGASAGGEIGEDHDPETHLIPRAIEAKLKGETLPIFGTDWQTPDGTCIRDYIHVDDIAAAHLLALDAHESLTVNLGTGCGHSVREITEAIGVEVTHEPRREGDIARLVCNSSLAKERLGFTPKSSDLRHIIETAYAWEKARLEALS